MPCFCGIFYDDITKNLKCRQQEKIYQLNVVIADQLTWPFRSIIKSVVPYTLLLMIDRNGHMSWSAYMTFCWGPHQLVDIGVVEVFNILFLCSLTLKFLTWGYHLSECSSFKDYGWCYRLIQERCGSMKSALDDIIQLT